MANLIQDHNEDSRLDFNVDIPNIQGGSATPAPSPSPMAPATTTEMGALDALNSLPPEAPAGPFDRDGTGRLPDQDREGLAPLLEPTQPGVAELYGLYNPNGDMYNADQSLHEIYSAFGDSAQRQLDANTQRFTGQLDNPILYDGRMFGYTDTPAPFPDSAFEGSRLADSLRSSPIDDALRPWASLMDVSPTRNVTTTLGGRGEPPSQVGGLARQLRGVLGVLPLVAEGVVGGLANFLPGVDDNEAAAIGDRAADIYGAANPIGAARAIGRAIQGDAPLGFVDEDQEIAGGQLDAGPDAEFQPFQGRFGSYGTGLAGGIIYGLDLVENVVRAGVIEQSARTIDDIQNGNVGEILLNATPLGFFMPDADNAAREALQGREFSFMAPSEDSGFGWTPVREGERGIQLPNGETIGVTGLGTAAGFLLDMITSAPADAVVEAALRTARRQTARGVADVAQETAEEAVQEATERAARGAVAPTEAVTTPPQSALPAGPEAPVNPALPPGQPGGPLADVPPIQPDVLGGEVGPANAVPTPGQQTVDVNATQVFDEVGAGQTARQIGPEGPGIQPEVLGGELQPQGARGELPDITVDVDATEVIDPPPQGSFTGANTPQLEPGLVPIQPDVLGGEVVRSPRRIQLQEFYDTIDVEGTPVLDFLQGVDQMRTPRLAVPEIPNLPSAAPTANANRYLPDANIPQALQGRQALSDQLHATFEAMSMSIQRQGTVQEMRNLENLQRDLRNQLARLYRHQSQDLNVGTFDQGTRWDRLQLPAAGDTQYVPTLDERLAELPVGRPETVADTEDFRYRYESVTPEDVEFTNLDKARERLERIGVSPEILAEADDLAITNMFYATAPNGGSMVDEVVQELNAGRVEFYRRDPELDAGAPGAPEAPPTNVEASLENSEAIWDMATARAARTGEPISPASLRESAQAVAEGAEVQPYIYQHLPDDIAESVAEADMAKVRERLTNYGVSPEILAEESDTYLYAADAVLRERIRPFVSDQPSVDIINNRRLFIAENKEVYDASLEMGLSGDPTRTLRGALEGSDEGAIGAARRNAPTGEEVLRSRDARAQTPETPEVETPRVEVDITPDTLRQRYGKFADAKAELGVKARSWQALADKIQADPDLRLRVERALSGEVTDNLPNANQATTNVVEGSAQASTDAVSNRVVEVDGSTDLGKVQRLATEAGGPLGTDEYLVGTKSVLPSGSRQDAILSGETRGQGGLGTHLTKDNETAILNAQGSVERDAIRAVPTSGNGRVYRVRATINNPINLVDRPSPGLKSDLINYVLDVFVQHGDLTDKLTKAIRRNPLGETIDAFDTMIADAGLDVEVEGFAFRQFLDDTLAANGYDGKLLPADNSVIPLGDIELQTRVELSEPSLAQQHLIAAKRNEQYDNPMGRADAVRHRLKAVDQHLDEVQQVANDAEDYVRQTLHELNQHEENVKDVARRDAQRQLQMQAQADADEYLLDSLDDYDLIDDIDDADIPDFCI